MLKQVYNPDVLTCIANLSSDEVFTPPSVVNQMLDTLPKELWSNEKTTFLDPVSKSGVFLREITKRLIDGLESKIPNLEERIEHILRNQVFGIGITELTSLISRRSLYCSKYANGKYSIVQFDDEQGNLKYLETEHTWEGNSCKYCGVSKEIYDRGEELESYSYSFIHSQNPEKLFNMKFDVIVGNPPYQMSDGGGTGDSAKPIYNKFVETSIKLNPLYISMIIPSRWMKGGKGLNSFRDKLMNDKRIKYLYDFENAKECFPGINLDGGVCYFLWDKNHSDKVEYIFKSISGDEIKSKRFLKSKFSEKIIRDFRQISILEKINSLNEKPFSSIVSTRKPYGVSTDLFNSPLKYGLEQIPIKPFKNSLRIFGVKGNKGGAKRVEGYIDEKLITNKKTVNKFKLFHSYAYTTTSTVPPKIIIGKPQEVCTETFLRIGEFGSELDAKYCLSYITTKFFRALLSFNRIQKNLSQSTFDLIPLQVFDKKWDDSMLYEKYNLNDSEIEYIETLVKPMEGYEL